MPEIRQGQFGMAAILALGGVCRLGGRQAAILVSLTFVGAMFDVAGLAMLYPIGEALLSGGDVKALVQSSPVWRHLNDAFLLIGMQASVAAVVVLMVALMLLRQVFSYFRLIYQSGLNYMITRRLRRELFERFLVARLSHQERLKSGNFANAMTTETVSAAHAMTVPADFLNGGMLMIVYFVLLIWISPVATVLVVLVLLLTGFGLKDLLWRVRQYGRDIVAANAAYDQHFLQRCRSARLIRLAQTEKRELDEADRLLHRQEKNNLRAAKVIALTNVGVEPLALIIGIPLLVTAVYSYGAPLSSVGMFFIVLARLAPMFRQLAGAWQSYLKVRASAENVMQLLDDLSAARETPGGSRILQPPVRDIAFENIHFRYPEAHRDAIDGVSLSIVGGSMVAIVGPSGGGKSTLIDLIPRLRAPQSGRVSIDGVALDEFEVASLRRACAYVSQTPLFIEGTIGDQIAYGTGQATEEGVLGAAKMANAHAFISALPDGYRTKLGEGGVGLSGGQRQRIDLARALLAKAPILILDEPTSNVDAESVVQITQALERICAETDTTIIMVAHQLGTIRGCDHIVVIEDGRISAEGSHASLMEQDGWYRANFRRQAASAGINPEIKLRAV
jgi:ABC-type multidrug transport system fused ATPase/permease subunit